MKMRFYLAALALAMSLASAPAPTVPPKAEAEAQVVAEKWLSLVDSGSYTASWQEMSGTFRKDVSKRRWNSTVEDLRKPLGKVVSRQLKSAEFTKDLQGAPDGEYVVLKFNTVFQNRSNVVETVTPMLETDLQWRVSGYSVK